VKVMAVGLTVDYVIHIAHAYVTVEATDVNDRLYKTLYTMGSPVAKGALTTLLGTALLSLSSSEAFRIFFKMLIGIIVISSLHGLIFLPAFAAEINCLLIDDDEKKVVPQNSGNTTKMIQLS